MNDDKIIQLIDNGEIEKAYEEISNIEMQIMNEKIKYTKASLMGRVKKLKTYLSKLQELHAIEEINLKEKGAIKVQNFNDDRKINDIYTITESNCSDNYILGKEIYVKDIKNREIGVYESESSIFISNLCDCTVSCIAQQIRINNCKRLKLFVHTISGVFLEDSSCIEISALDCGKKTDNLYYKVWDFSNPLGNENYKIIS
ncbi:hypothetical protein EDEG_03261 [Edhazardia aedis USNM 41457]|uniref:C-CAP/cofactor C-like domain-containing protein n=1 Tax=Edhazardia aedis (strain USNM 41457) TaxID=1003232 RepID=J9DLP6_EDHAE|nr:hypothetical protein EDEG_03261 [Edhazardia aedis USNM 41457]|eukprot:EJW02297.1 hypothetical protein EDEG_03261 [Edhazardia aedis USNM 41457]